MILVIAICFLIFLYNLYFVSHEDFVIVRKGIPMEKIFNIAIITSVVSLFFSRLTFVLFNPQAQYLNVVGFIAFPYLPGLSLIGAIVFGLIFLSLFLKNRKYPIGKFIDLFTVAFLGVLPIGFLLGFILTLGKTSLAYNILLIISFFLSLVFIKIVYKLCEKGELKDGSFTLIFLSVFSLIYFLIKLFINIKSFSFDSENIVLFITIFASLILLVNHEIMNRFLDKK